MTLGWVHDVMPVVLQCDLTILLEVQRAAVVERYSAIMKIFALNRSSLASLVKVMMAAPNSCLESRADQLNPVELAVVARQNRRTHVWQ